MQLVLDPITVASIEAFAPALELLDTGARGALDASAAWPCAAPHSVSPCARRGGGSSRATVPGLTRPLPASRQDVSAGVLS